MISVIIPTFNREEVIERSIKSVLNQTYNDLEVIVVDDCSSDNTCDVVNKLKEKDNRLFYYRLKKNCGANYARNTGIVVSTGEYIAFQDSDDEWLHDKLEVQLREMEKENYDIIGCKMRVNPHKENKVIPNKMYVKRALCRKDMIPYNLISTQTLLIKREVIKKNLFDENMERFQDWELVLRLSTKFDIGFLNEIKVYQYHQKSSISLNPQKGIIALENLKNKNKEWYKSNNKFQSTIWFRKSLFQIQLRQPSFKYFLRSLRTKYLFGSFSDYTKQLVRVYFLHREKKNVK